MNFLFFDIECSDGNHICSFGYVMVNNKFEILNKEDIVINPKREFKLGRAGFDPKICLAYDENTFKKQKPFKFFYDKIKSILTSSENIILGHAITSDLQFLKIACKRYGLPQIDVQVYDTQNFYYQYNKKYKARSLDNIVKDLEIDVTNLYEHKSCDDAEISMLITKEICKRLDLTIEELLDFCSDSIKQSNNKGKKQINKNSPIYIEFMRELNKKGLSLNDFN